MSATPNQPSRLRKGSKLTILNAAEELFQRYGFKRVTVEEICAHARVSKMTFYKYFRNKEAVVIQILSAKSEAAYEEAQAIMASTRSFPEKVQLLVAQKHKNLAQMSEAFLQDYLQDEGAVQEYIQAVSARVTDLFIAFLKRSQERGELIVTVKPELFLAYLDKMTELARNQQLADLYPSYNEYLEVLNNIFYYGIVPRG